MVRPMVLHCSASVSASESSLFGVGSLAACTCSKNRPTGAAVLPTDQPGFVFNENGDEFVWTGLLSGSRLLTGLSWGVSCLRTDCRENQDGWAVHIFGSERPSRQSASHPTAVAAQGLAEKGELAAGDDVPTKVVDTRQDHDFASGPGDVPRENPDNPAPSSHGPLSDLSTTMPSSSDGPTAGSNISSNKIESDDCQGSRPSPQVAHDFSENRQPMNPHSGAVNSPGAVQPHSPAFNSARSTATASNAGQGRAPSHPGITSTELLSNATSAEENRQPSTKTLSFGWSHELATAACTDLPVSITVLHDAGPADALSPSNEGETLGVQDSSIIERGTYIGASTFVVLDGHGAGGRDAAAAVEKAFETVWSLPFPLSRIRADPTLLGKPTALFAALATALRAGQLAIETLNEMSHRDFGTTCVTVTLVDDILISSSCGDSSALLFAFPPGDWSAPNAKGIPVVVELSRRHHLEDTDELERINRQGRGRVIRGDGGVLRLIPGDIEYEEAKRRGLSINMSRSMGHSIFSRCGLSTEIDYFFLSLKQIAKLLDNASPSQNHDQGVGPNHFAKCYRLPPFNQAEAERVLRHFCAKPSKSVQQSRSTSEGGAMRQNPPYGGHGEVPEETTTQQSNSVAVEADENAPTKGSPRQPGPTSARGAERKEMAQPPSANHTRRRRSLFKSGNCSASGPVEATQPGATSNSARGAGWPSNERPPGNSGISSRSLRSFVDSRPPGGLLKCFARRGASSPSRETAPARFAATDSLKICDEMAGDSLSNRRFIRCGSAINNARTAGVNSTPNAVASTPICATSGTQTKKSASGLSSATTASTATSSTAAPPMGDMFVLLMSDGVTDVLSASCIIEAVKDFDMKSKSTKEPFNPSAFALTLTEVARERRIKACQRADNCTCLAVHLIPKNSGDGMRDKVAQ